MLEKNCTFLQRSSPCTMCVHCENRLSAPVNNNEMVKFMAQPLNCHVATVTTNKRTNERYMSRMVKRKCAHKNTYPALLNIPSKRVSWEMHKHTKWSSIQWKLADSNFVLTQSLTLFLSFSLAVSRIHNRFSILIEPKMWESAYGLVENIRRLQFHSTKITRRKKANTPLSWSNAKRTVWVTLNSNWNAQRAHLSSIYYYIYKNTMWKSLRILHILKFVERFTTREEKNRIENVYFIRIVCTFTKS